MVKIELGRDVEMRIDDLGILSVVHITKGTVTSILPIGEATRARLGDLQVKLQRMKAFAVDTKLSVKPEFA